MSSDLSFELAQKHTQSFAENVLHEHHDAMQCRDCEEMLEAGITAFKWIVIAEKVLREADQNGIMDLTLETENAITALWEYWIKPVEKAEQLIAQTLEKGFVPDNMNEFRNVKTIAIETFERIGLINASRNRLFSSYNGCIQK